MMTSKADSHEGRSSSNPFIRLQQVFQAEGTSALLAGLGPRMLRALCSGAVQFAAYEIANNYLKS